MPALAVAESLPDILTAKDELNVDMCSGNNEATRQPWAHCMEK